jgi:O-antigen/teichoic acid export membrane protein
MSVVQFIRDFLSRKGLFVLLSTVVAKAVNFLVLILVINLLPQSEYGRIAYGLTIIGFIAPFVGGGIHQGLLRFGALSKGQYEKKILFQDTFKIGFKYSIWIVVGILILSPLLTRQMPGALPILLLLSIQVFALFALQMIQVYCRLLNQNQLFARIDIQHNILLLISSVSLVYFFGGMGYVISLIAVPLLMGLYYLRRLRLFPFTGFHERIAKVRTTFHFSKRELVQYGLFMSLGGVVSQLLYAVDILLIGNLLDQPEDQVAIYKVASIFPYSVLIFAVAMMTTDFVKLAKDAVERKSVLWNYYFNYLKVFGSLSIALLLFFYVAAPYLLRIFGTEYQGYENLVYIFTIGVVGGILVRIPMGNMLSAIGWPRLNALFSAIILLINLIANYFMILNYGIIGAAITTAALMWLSGLLSFGAFIYFLRR